MVTANMGTNLVTVPSAFSRTLQREAQVQPDRFFEAVVVGVGVVAHIGRIRPAAIGLCPTRHR